MNYQVRHSHHAYPQGGIKKSSFSSTPKSVHFSDSARFETETQPEAGSLGSRLESGDPIQVLLVSRGIFLYFIFVTDMQLYIGVLGIYMFICRYI